mmetsp:Transcript_21058/g.48324  ORF Transcript_21058/g.48324 Transcript_21058/m.48324 type:complete len:217 (-) Transcript_21058:583-1233(-)
MTSPSATLVLDTSPDTTTTTCSVVLSRPRASKMVCGISAVIPLPTSMTVLPPSSATLTSVMTTPTIVKLPMVVFAFVALLSSSKVTMRTSSYSTSATCCNTTDPPSSGSAGTSVKPVKSMPVKFVATSAKVVSSRDAKAAEPPSTIASKLETTADAAVSCTRMVKETCHSSCAVSCLLPRKRASLSLTARASRKDESRRAALSSTTTAMFSAAAPV